MSIRRWLRFRRALKRRKLISSLRRVNRSIVEVRAQLAAVRDYRPTCLGGFEDRMNGEDQVTGWLRRLEWQHYGLARRLKMSTQQASGYL